MLISKIFHWFDEWSVLPHSTRVHGPSSSVSCVLVLTQSELGDATGQRCQGRSDWVQSQPSPRTNVQPICSTYSISGIHCSTLNFFLDRKGPLPEYLLYFASCITQNTSHCSIFSSKFFFSSFFNICCYINKESLHRNEKSFFFFTPITFISVQFHSLWLMSQYACGMGWTVQKGLLYYSCESLCFFFFVRVANL